MKVKVSEYRDLIDAVPQWLNSLKSAVTDAERRNEAAILRRAVDELKAANCPTAKYADRQRASDWLAAAEQALAAVPEEPR